METDKQIYDNGCFQVSVCDRDKPGEGKPWPGSSVNFPSSGKRAKVYLASWRRQETQEIMLVLTEDLEGLHKHTLKYWIE